MILFYRLLLFFALLFGVSVLASAQESAIELSEEKVIVDGKIYLLHLVKKQQTLFSISKAYGVSAKEIMEANGKAEENLNVDEILKIPFAMKSQNEDAFSPQNTNHNKFIYHTVKKNDTLYSLSKKYGVDIAAIVKENEGSSQSLVLNSIVKIPKTQVPSTEKTEPQTNKPRYDKKYFYYIVQAGDTQYGISRKFSIRKRKLRRLNPQLKSDMLKQGDRLRIPVNLVPSKYFEELNKETQKVPKEKELKEKQESFTEKHLDADSIKKHEVSEIPQEFDDAEKSEIRIALFLPLYLDINDTINQIVVNKENPELVEERKSRIIYEKSVDFIRFYQGVLLAVDSLQKEGLSVNLHVFDTERDPQKLTEILSEIQSTPFDYWIGPVYPKTFALATKVAQERGIPIISPLSAKNPQISFNANVIQLNTSLASICQQVSESLIHDYPPKNLVLIHPENPQKLQEFNLIENIEYQLFEKGEYWNTEDLFYQKISFKEYGFCGIEALMRDSCENIVVLPSNDQAWVENLITKLNVLSRRYRIRLFGFSRWQRFSSVEPELFYKLRFTTISPYFIDYEREEVKAFVEKFRTRFHCEPNDFSFRAYDACRFFSLAAGKFGRNFPVKMNEIDLELLQSVYFFRRNSNKEGFENVGTHLVNYSTDFQILHRNTRKEEEETAD